MAKQRMSEVIRARIKANEKIVLTDAARRRGMSLSELLRWAAFRAAGAI